MLPDEIKKAYLKINLLLGTAKLCHVDVCSLTLDRTINSIILETNIVSFLKSSHDDSFDDLDSFYLDAYQAPVICYEVDGLYYVISGLFTYAKLQRTKILDEKILAPCLVISSRPKPSERKLIFLNDVLRIMLKQYFNVSGASISALLKSLFSEEASVFKTQSWQVLFPKIKTQTELCAWLKISTKVVKL